ncbi:hypothetical protein AJ79_00844 [Helicocarpus griseus UAMH5409]|uniref:RTA1 like protein n=1 Tax=Helicocarpus griseus UAMH5409 TaxID=1447875 RepID=A0A2B7Y9L6_9EURO|nr:hypothetical protein AJ79_00844 [Helicocarpus griseus UAMH5409]
MSNVRGSLDDPNIWVPYRYEPSKAAAIIFTVVFALTTILHVFQIFRTRTWYFIPLVVGGVFEIVGYAGRVLSSEDLWALGPYIMQALLLLVAPALFAASIYMILGRIIHTVNGEKYSIIPLKWLTKLFVTGDVISFTVQAAGGGIQAIGNLSALHAGEKIIIVGLFIQIAFFGFFMVVSWYFRHRFVKGDGPATTAAPWRKHINALYAASILILVRSVFRVVEYLMGNNGYLLRHEYFLFIFDAVLMFFVMVLFNWVHPSEITRYKETGMLELR